MFSLRRLFGGSSEATPPRLAHIGDTREQVRAYFGEPDGEEPQVGLDAAMGVQNIQYAWKEFIVQIAYINGAAAFLMFKKKFGSLTAEEAEEVLTALGEEGEWTRTFQNTEQPGYRYWCLVTKTRGTLRSSWVEAKAEVGIVGPAYVAAYDAAKKARG